MAKKGIVFAFLFVFASLCAGRTITVSLDGTGEFSTIQAAIDASINGDVVIVWPGLYRENINFTGKDIVLVSTEPENRHVVENTVIQGYGSCSVVTFAGFESESCELKGFKITGGNKADRGGGIIGNHCRATITNCIVTGNTAEIGGGISRCCGLISNCIISGNTAFYCGGGISDGWGSIVNCVIEGNKAMEFGGGIAWNASKFFGCIISGNTSKDESGQNYGGAAIVSMCNPFINCTICNNNALNGGACILLDPGSGGEFVNCIIWGNNSSATFSEPVGLLSVRNSCVEGGCSISEPYLWMVEWENNIELCPEFYDADAGDYRLQPWSPCIDAGVIDWYLGIPIAEYDIEGNGRVVDGDNDNVKWIDMGAYESPPCEEPVIGVSEFEFGFAAWAGGSYPREYEFTVRNRGGGELNWTRYVNQVL